MCMNCPRPIDAVSPSPETPMEMRFRLASIAPVATAGIRPWTALKPWDRDRKYAGVLDEQPMPENLATISGLTLISKNARTIWLLIASWPHPAQRVDFPP